MRGDQPHPRVNLWPLVAAVWATAYLVRSLVTDYTPGIIAGAAGALLCIAAFLWPLRPRSDDPDTTTP